uniref:Uncharacterized protein n=1 Tax=viral metagenome TaxID=1070528 RepID=A0A6C0BFP9_9ZZZZ
MSCYAPQQALTRLRNDPFHQVDDMRITSYAARYYLNPPAMNCPTTFPVNATTRLQRSGNSWVEGEWKTDVESDLKGINRLGSKIRCSPTEYNPDRNMMNQRPLQNAEDENVPQTFARLVDPPCTLRTTGWNRWQPLFHNPQETFETPFDFFIPSRDIDKEKYNTHREQTCFTPKDQPSVSELGHEKDMYPRIPGIFT